MKVLFLGDVVGKPGRRAVVTAMPELRRRYSPDLIVANGENSAGGIGITEKSAGELFDAGVDVLTTGNHVYRHRDAYEFIDRETRVVRPLNYPAGSPGRGHTIAEADGRRIAVVNLSGQLNLTVARSPFLAIDAELEKLEGEADCIVVDFHADVTSEKVAMGWHLDGRVAAVWGTHTHVPTADARILPGGTAAITDAGMTGSRAGVLGVNRDQSVEGFRTQMPVRFTAAQGDVWINGVSVEIRDDGLAESIEQVLLPVAD